MDSHKLARRKQSLFRQRGEQEEASLKKTIAESEEMRKDLERMKQTIDSMDDNNDKGFLNDALDLASILKDKSTESIKRFIKLCAKKFMTFRYEKEDLLHMYNSTKKCY